MIRKLFWLFLPISFLFVGCASTPRTALHTNETESSSVSSTENDSNAILNEIVQAENEFERMHEKNSHKLPDVPVEVNEKVKKWIHYFTVTDRDRFERYLKRGHSYRKMIERNLGEEGIPSELYYLALIESGFAIHAKSRAKAVGVWQFMKGTATRYGLRVDPYVDERKDPIRATRAAAVYLRDLHNVFNSWYLAIAAYNAGERRVLGAIMKGNSRDFWDLMKKSVLPRETMNYVPKFLAAWIVGRNPEKFGFAGVEGPEYPEVELVEVPSPVRIKDVAYLTRTSKDLLASLNPNIKRGVTSPRAPRYGIWVPKGLADEVQAKQTVLAKLRVRTSRIRRSESKNRLVASTSSGSQVFHRVRRGETLYSIARRYRVPVSYLKKINRLRSSQIQAGTRLKIAIKDRIPSQSKWYRVKRGDNLTLISKRTGVDLRTLRRLNGLSSGRIYPGQKLRLASSNDIKRHRVKRGDNLTVLARLYGMSLSQLKQLNGLRNNRIHPGQVLKVSGAEVTRYRVQRGDNLISIAKRFGVSVSEIKSHNDLRQNEIYAGQTLVVDTNGT